VSDPRIIDVQLDDKTILWRSADVEQERRIAIFDLIEGNYFKPVTPARRRLCRPVPHPLVGRRKAGS
jgi:uncharacterized protein (UPF0262 family)